MKTSNRMELGGENIAQDFQDLECVKKPYQIRYQMKMTSDIDDLKQLLRPYK